MRKAGADPSYPPVAEDGPSHMPAKGWAEMIRKVYEVDPLTCPSCGGKMSIIDLSVLEVIILFQDIRGWKMGKIVRDSSQAQKGNSYL